MAYDKSFYDTINAGSRSSAEIVVPFVLEVIGGADGVVDVGCGEGVWTAVFAEHGCDVVGVDGVHVDQSRLQIPVERFRALDIQHQRVTDLKADLAVSLEVAEHLSSPRAMTFVEDLCSIADIVLFSAAIPGQGGTGHVNEQWPEYWVELFEHCGRLVTGALRWAIWDDARSGRVENWYAQNLLLAVTPEALAKRPSMAVWFEAPMAHPYGVVHPVLWDSRR